MIAYSQSFDRPFRTARSACHSSVDRDFVLVIYVLYAIGFFTGITAVGGALLAHFRVKRAQCDAARQQFVWQIRLFWLGVLAWTVIGLLHGAIATLGAVTGGIGLVFMIVPWSLIALWGVLTLWAMARGLLALARGRAVV